MSQQQQQPPPQQQQQHGAYPLAPAVASRFRPSGPRVGSRGALPPPTRPTHDYKRSPNDRHPVDVARVDSLIVARMNAKISRDFDRADSLRMELRQLGVEVHDRDKKGLWTGRSALQSLRKSTAAAAARRCREAALRCRACRAAVRPPRRPPPPHNNAPPPPGSGMHALPPPPMMPPHGPGGGYGAPPPSGGSYGGGGGVPPHGGFGGGGGGGGSAPMPEHDYSRDPNDPISLHPEQLRRIHGMLGERLAAKRARDYARRTACEDLRVMCGVEVLDRDKTWRAVPGAHPFTRRRRAWALPSRPLPWAGVHQWAGAHPRAMGPCRRTG